MSIGDPGSQLPSGFRRIARKLRLEFEDVSSDIPLAPQRDDIQQLISFSETMTAESVVLVHCEAGISRSPAAGIIILAQHLGAGYESLATSTVMSCVEFAAPNARMLVLADDALKRGGALVEAVDAALPMLPLFF